MRVTLADIGAAIEAALARPEADAIYCGKLSLADLGNHALFALDHPRQCTLRGAQAFLKDAAEAELAEGIDGGFRAAYELLLTFVQQVVVERGCPDCDAERGRDCSVPTTDGRKLGREWIHDARALEPAVVA